MSKFFDQLAYVLAVGLGTGLSPVAPGTVGSLLGLAIAVLLVQVAWWLLPVYALLGSVLGIWICDVAATRIGDDDPGAIVWDEIAGISIACCGWLFIYPRPIEFELDSMIDGNSAWPGIVLSFALFRLLDILKPWPISWLDENLHGGWGIMADDLLAGLMAAVASVVLMRLILGA